MTSRIVSGCHTNGLHKLHVPVNLELKLISLGLRQCKVNQCLTVSDCYYRLNQVTDYGNNSVAADVLHIQ